MVSGGIYFLNASPPGDLPSLWVTALQDINKEQNTAPALREFTTAWEREVDTEKSTSDNKRDLRTFKWAISDLPPKTCLVSVLSWGLPPTDPVVENGRPCKVAEGTEKPATQSEGGGDGVTVQGSRSKAWGPTQHNRVSECLLGGWPCLPLDVQRGADFFPPLSCLTFNNQVNKSKHLNQFLFLTTERSWLMWGCRNLEKS